MSVNQEPDKELKLEKKRTSLSQIISGSLESIDLYGQKIQLKYQGKDEYKTSCGGFLSLFLIIYVFLYGVLKFHQLASREDWQLASQKVVATSKDLNQERVLSEDQFKNISMSLQFRKKKEKQTLSQLRSNLNNPNKYNSGSRRELEEDS